MCNSPSDIGSDPNAVQRMYIDGDSVVLPSGCLLLQRCIITNRPVEECDMVFAKLYWAPQRITKSLVGGYAALVFHYFVEREQFEITYGLERTIRRKQTLITVLKVLAAIGFLTATIALSISVSTHWVISWLIAICFILFIVSVFLLFIGNSPISITQQNGHMFWVRGCSPEYLAELTFEE